MKRIMARQQAVEVHELTEEQKASVNGGSILGDIEQRHPNGVWVGNSFFPNGLPRQQGMGIITLGANEAS